MRKIFLVLMFICVLFVLTESKGKWKKKKHHLKMMAKKGKGGHHHGMGNNLSKHKMKKIMKRMKKMEKMTGDDWSSYNPRFMKKVSPKKQMAWLKIKSEKDCDLKCKPKEVCIVGPVDAKLMCVSKKNLKKSMKMFHKYQKKEKKAWRAFKIKNYNKDEENDHTYYSKFDTKLTAEHKKETETGMVKPHHKRVKVEDTAKESQDCTPVQFSQMRRRMMGWFHLLHGQHHMTSGGKGTIKQFHKHSSMKKEVRQLNDSKCECAKSAMWQFKKMDKVEDDFLDEEEISMMYENEAEPCMRPFFTSCDLNADQKLSSDEWCCCFSNIVAPCFVRLEEIKKEANAVQYTPRCDKEGYYKSEQCSGEKHASFKCWCVDYNGNQYRDSEREGRAYCDNPEKVNK